MTVWHGPGHGFDLIGGLHMGHVELWEPSSNAQQLTMALIKSLNRLCVLIVI